MTRRHKQSRPFRDDYSQESKDDMFRSPNPKRFYRSRTDNVFGGVCGGIAERFGWDSTLVRLLMAVLVFSGAATAFIVIGYIVICMITPKTPVGQRQMAPEEETFWRNVSDRPRMTASGLKYTFMDLEDRLRNLERNVTSEEWRLKKAFRDLDQN